MKLKNLIILKKYVDFIPVLLSLVSIICQILKSVSLEKCKIKNKYCKINYEYKLQEIFGKSD